LTEAKEVMNEKPTQRYQPDDRNSAREPGVSGHSQPRRAPRHAAGMPPPGYDPVPGPPASHRVPPEYSHGALPDAAHPYPAADGQSVAPPGGSAPSWVMWLRRFSWWRSVAVAAVAGLIAAAAVTIAQENSTTAVRATGRARAAAAGPGHPGDAVQPVISKKAARQVLARFTRINNEANRLRDNALLATIESGSSYVMDTGAYRMQRAINPDNSQYVAFGPEKAAFYIPRQSAASYPHFFVVKVAYADLAGPHHVTSNGYLLFTRSSPEGSWKDVLEPDMFPGGGHVPPIAVDDQGYAQQVSLIGSACGLTAPPAQIQRDTIRWLDDNAADGSDPANAGNLADLSDVQSWRRHLPGGTVADKHVPGPGRAFALRTTDGGAIIFYSLTARLEITSPPGDTFRVEIPGYYSPTQSLRSAAVGYAEQFAATDPPRGHGFPRVVADTSSIAG
jgi:hypothetical protein